MKRIIVAIDGYSSSGKSTLAKNLARTVGYQYIDTGAMYRAVTLLALQEDLLGDVNSLIEALPRVPLFCADLNLRSPEVAKHVSQVAAIPEVREFLVEKQRELGRQGGIVMDGRDIGTVVFPGAELKVFVTASPEVRAERRWKELADRGVVISKEEVLSSLLSRDRIDSSREVSPLRQAPNAILLDNGNLTIEEQDKWLLEKFYERTRQGK